MIKWSDIESECIGFRKAFISVFKKYEGQETDEKDAQGRTVKVTMASFARHMGIAEQTFRRWVITSTTGVPLPGDENRSVSKTIEEAAAKAKAEAEAAAQQALAAALERQARENEAKAKRAAEEAEKARKAAELKHQQEMEAERKRIAAEESEKAQKRLKEIEARIRAEIQAEPPTPEVLAEMAKQALTSSDPDIVSKMAEAYGKHRIEQDARDKADAAARAAASRAAKAERDARDAERRASKEYEDSALKLFMDAYETLVEANLLLSRKPITFSNVVASGRTEGELLDTIEEAVEISRRIEANIMDATLTSDPVDVV